jgi:putative endonuclease
MDSTPGRHDRGTERRVRPPVSTAERRSGTDRLALGRYGEDLAVRYLRERGWSVLERNWRCEHGEIDIVARERDCLVICEVKTRRSTDFGEPVEAVTPVKAMRLRRLAAAYLEASGSSVPHVRIDVIGLLCCPDQPVMVRHVVAVGA